MTDDERYRIQQHSGTKLWRVQEWSWRGWRTLPYGEWSDADSFQTREEAEGFLERKLARERARLGECPFCQQFESKVVRSSPDEADAYRRERRCLNCHRTYLTMETVVRLLKESSTQSRNC
jgi:hypothetical protein